MQHPNNHETKKPPIRQYLSTKIAAGTGKEEQLLQPIVDWTTQNGTGSEIGRHIEDPNHPDNTIGEAESVPNTDDARAYPYRVLGTHCGSWACKIWHWGAKNEDATFK